MNIKTFFKKIREGKEPSQEFHNSLRASLVAHMRDNPPTPRVIRAAEHRSPAFWQKGLAIAFAALLIICTAAAGTVSAAQKALPGDALYPIKLAADQLSASLSNSPNVRIAVASRRLQEVQQALASRPTQSAQVQADIQSALQQYQADLRGVVTDISAKNIASATVQQVIHATAKNQNNIEQMLSVSATGTIANDLQNSLQNSHATIVAAQTIITDNGDAKNKGFPWNDPRAGSSSPTTTTRFQKNGSEDAAHPWTGTYDAPTSTVTSTPIQAREDQYQQVRTSVSAGLATSTSYSYEIMATDSATPTANTTSSSVISVTTLGSAARGGGEQGNENGSTPTSTPPTSDHHEGGNDGRTRAGGSSSGTSGTSASGGHALNDGGGTDD